MSTSRSLRQPSAARAKSVKSRSDLQISPPRAARATRARPAQLIASREPRAPSPRAHSPPPRSRPRRRPQPRRPARSACRPSCYVLPEAVWPYARTSVFASHRGSIARLAMPSTQTRPMARPQQGTQRFTRHHRVTMVSSDVTREHRNGTRAAVAKCVGGAFRCCTRGTERARPRR